MIFAATHRLVVRGAKTATRRPMVPYPLELPDRPAPGIGHHPAPPAWPKKVRAFDQDWKALSYKPGDVRAVQPGRGQHAVGHITIRAIRSERLGTITEQDAIAEGFKDRAGFVRTWVGLHDKPWARFTDELLARLPARPEQLARLATDLNVSERTLVRRLRYLMTAGAAHIDTHTGAWDRCEHGEHEARRFRFDDRHAQHPVWVVTFDLIQDTAVMLAARPPRASSKPDDNDDTSSLENRGYTLSPYQAAQEEHTGIVGRSGPVMLPVDAIGPAELDAMTKDARSAARIRIEHETRNERQAMVDAINRLSARDDIGEAAARRLANMRRELQRLDAELRAA